MTNGTSQGLFIVVAIVIFGIFVGLSYTLFSGELSPALNGLFGDATEQAGDILGGDSGSEYSGWTDVESTREKDGFIYAKIRTADANGTDFWVKAKKTEDGKGLVVVSSSDRDYPTGTYWNTPHFGDLVVVSDLYTFPDLIDGIPIVGFEDKVFNNANFKDNIVFPKGLLTIGNFTFYNSELKGTFNAPKNLVSIGDYAFHKAMFTGELKLPTSIRTLGNHIFSVSDFSGDLVLPEGLETIGEHTFTGVGFEEGVVIPSTLKNIPDGAFVNTPFKGTIKIAKGVENIGERAFTEAKFTGNLIIPEGVKTIGSISFVNSKFTGELILPETLITIGSSAFQGSIFTSVTKLNPNTSLDGAFKYGTIIK